MDAGITPLTDTRDEFVKIDTVPEVYRARLNPVAFWPYAAGQVLEFTRLVNVTFSGVANP
jgi:hypothetical protein